MQKDLSTAIIELTDKECEKAVIGALIISPSCYFKIGNLLKAEIFTDPKYKAVYEAISYMIFNGQEVDVITLKNYMIQNPVKGLTVENWAYEITEISSSCATSATAYSNAANLNDLWQRRQILFNLHKLADGAADRTKDVTDTISEAAEKMQSISDNAVTDISTAADALDELEAMLIAQAKGEGTGSKTGFLCFDERGGMKPTHLNVIGAYPGQGKSSIALQMAINVATEGDPIAFYTMEMSKAELMARAVSVDAGINVSTLLNRPEDLTEEEWQRIRTSKSKLGNLPIYFNEEATTSIEDILCSAKTFVRRNKIKGIFVDYLQIMGTNRRDKKTSREEFYGDVVRLLKNLAKQEKIFVVLLSQLSRDHDSKEPSPDYLRGSGQIFEGCDNCYLIFRPEATGSVYSGKYANVEPTGTAQIQVCKCRNGQVWQKYILGFKGEQTQFFELGRVPMLNSIPQKEVDEDRPF